MKLIYFNNNFKYETEAIIRLFFPMQKFEYEYIENLSFDDLNFHLVKAGDFFCFLDEDDAVSVIVRYGEQQFYKHSFDFTDKEYTLCTLLYKILTEMTEQKQPWGMLTGIRPVKMIPENFFKFPKYIKHSEDAMLYILKSKYPYEIVNPYVRQLSSKYSVSFMKSILATETAYYQKPIIDFPKGELSLYISIPFCPSRCSYCSFISHSIESALKLIPEYVNLLCKELEFAAKLFRQKIDSIYIGGGTPTTLTANQLAQILSKLSLFNLSPFTEITVEAGRPDTINTEKLNALKYFGVGRVSINPQTFNQDILENIGRKHTVKEIYEAYSLTRKYPFSVNMDLIAGLPGDTISGFRTSLNKCLALAPENITIHALSLKRGSRIYTNRELNSISYETTAAWKKLERLHYKPYYLYRQKNTLGNLENTGYSKSGHFCRYNIHSMSDSQSILAFGAGGVSKAIKNNRIERIANYKYPYEYITNFQTILSRKSSFFNICRF
ncbi:MAG: coproporphyrinogen dehydrogenase HemZ [Oscillospiraceae bacterium]|jgi:oxygen-independent coproporphyrinogen-3 oxidase|nr:coproporphyrinogen dehydrogenase HemZ [Oscillospiraceae bacterium]